MIDIPREAVETLKSSMRGTVITPSDPTYNEARAVWNATIDRRPALIARCAGTADIMTAMAFAREHGLLLSIRGGAHNIAGSAVSDDALMLDLSTLRSVRIDPKAKRAYVEPGALLSDFDHEAQAFGLATPLGINSTTGVAGLTLGGGFGWLSRKFGVTVDNLVAAEIVTADGQWRRVDEEHDADLFWALRGGGGNFGVVTLFEFRLHEVGPQVYGGLVVYPLEQAAQVLPKYREFVNASADDLTVWAVMRLAPPLPFLPPEVHGKPIVALACCYIGPIEDGARALEAVHGFGTPYGEHLGPMPFAAWQKAFDPLLTPGARNYWKSHNFGSLNDETFDILTKAVENLPSPHCEVFIGAMAGQTNRVPADATAYANRESAYTINIHGRWTDAADDERCIGWARDMFAAMTPHALGSVYVNFMTGEEGERVKAAYGPNFERLAQVKRRYDPENVFRSNQNIVPAA